MARILQRNMWNERSLNTIDLITGSSDQSQLEHLVLAKHLSHLRQLSAIRVITGEMNLSILLFLTL